MTGTNATRLLRIMIPHSWWELISSNIILHSLGCRQLKILPKIFFSWYTLTISFVGTKFHFYMRRVTFYLELNLTFLRKSNLTPRDKYFNLLLLITLILNTDLTSDKGSFQFKYTLVDIKIILMFLCILYKLIIAIFLAHKFIFSIVIYSILFCT